MNRRALLVAAAAGTAAPARPRAQSRPAGRPITVIVPLGAGSASDVAVRIVAARMAIELGRPLVIENHPGAAGLLGAERATRAPADGTTLVGISDSVLTSAPLITANARFNPLTDLEPISQFAITEWALVASIASGLRSVPELIAATRARPGGIDFASGGIGSPQHTAMEIFSRGHGLTLNHVPYRSATAALNDVAAGIVPVMFTATSVAQGPLAGGLIHALATLGTERAALLPAIPTLAEAGGGDMLYRTWTAFMAPPRTPPELIAQFAAAIAQALADPEIRARLLASGLVPWGTTPEAFRTNLAADHAAMAELVRTANIRAE